MVVKLIARTLSAILLSIVFVIAAPIIVTHTPILWVIAGTLWATWVGIFVYRNHQTRKQI